VHNKVILMSWISARANVGGWVSHGLLLVLLLTGQAAAQAQPGKGRKSTPEALVLFADAANFQNNMAFDLAVQEWNKLLARFPDEPKAVEARYNLGVCHLQLKQFEKAAEVLSAAIASNDPFKQREDAYLNLGWSQYSLGLPANPDWLTKADATFAALLEKFPQGKYRDQALFFRGESLYLLGKKQEAVAAYKQLVDEQTESPLRADGLYALGVTYEELKQYADAGKIYDLFLNDFAEHQLVVEVRMRKAETVLQAGDLADAEQRFAEVAAVKDFGSVDHALSRQAYCASRQEKFVQAGQLYAQLVQAHPKSVYAEEAKIAAGRAFFRAQKLDEAQKWYDRVIAEGGPHAPEAAHWQNRIYLRAGQPQKAVELATASLSKAADSPYALHLQIDLADALYELPDRRAEAVPRYLKIFQDHPDDALAPQALYNAALTCLELERFDEGLAHAAQFLEKFPENTLRPDVQNVAAECQLQLKKYDQAEAIFRGLIADQAQRPEIDPWRVRLGLVLYLQGKHDETASTLEPLLPQLKSKNDLAEAHYLIGMSYLARDNFDRAAASLAAAIEAAPKWRQADETLLHLSRAQRRLNQLDQARATAQRLLKEFPDSSQVPQAHLRLAEYADAAEDYAAAIENYGTVISTWPDSPLVPFARYGRGLAALRQGDAAAAVASLSELLTATPDHRLVPQARRERAIARQRTGEFAGAVEDVQAYLKAAPNAADAADVLYVRGLSEVGLKQLDAAVATFQSILEKHPDYAAADKVLYELGWAYKTLGKENEAAVQFTQLAARFSGSSLAAEARFHVGEQAYTNRDYQAAREAYAAARAAGASGELAEKLLYKLGWAHYQLKHYEPAAEAFAAQLQAAPAGPLAADGLFMQAECLMKLEKFAEALPAYVLARQSQPSSPEIAVLILLHGGQSAAQLEKWDESLAWLSEIGQKHPETPYLAEALYEQGWAQQNLNKLAEALDLYSQASEKSRSEVGARARFMMGEIHFAQKNFAEAIAQFQRVMYGYGGAQAPEEIKRWQAKAGLEAGQCAALLAGQASGPEEKNAQVENARKFFRYVTEQHPQATEAAAAAAEQLKKLGG